MATIYLIMRSHCHSYRIIGSSGNDCKLFYLKFFLKLQPLFSVLYIQLFWEQNSKIKGKLFSSFSWFQCQRVQRQPRLKAYRYKMYQYESISCFSFANWVDDQTWNLSQKSQAGSCEKNMR